MRGWHLPAPCRSVPAPCALPPCSKALLQGLPCTLQQSGARGMRTRLLPSHLPTSQSVRLPALQTRPLARDTYTQAQPKLCLSMRVRSAVPICSNGVGLRNSSAASTSRQWVSARGRSQKGALSSQPDPVSLLLSDWHHVSPEGRCRGCCCGWGCAQGRCLQSGQRWGAGRHGHTHRPQAPSNRPHTAACCSRRSPLAPPVLAVRT